MQKVRLASTAGALLLALGLGACNQTTAANQPQVVAAAVPTGTAPRPDLPPQAACTKDYDHYQDILKADVTTGNVDQKVYEQIQGELSKASSACAAGRDGEALALIRASKSRHGYHA
ncbi:hypothetical protein [Beijerinckia indica]|uniref:Lipoprotein n=1 Tax=Beijerinckia indica subsp. indica (strain ATCC 9039 / DSM 1715 / NCIMB 8712) TaxID=395963 RepID=B2IGD5_BEII9|nr:hypothetical protein [Beijerinckia indica]ACB94320.1 conserved hypothetical protein [Beijerinckia indica subsp. indica ATCC 9039]